MSKAITRMEKFLTEQRDLERFDVSKVIMNDVSQIGKDLMTLAKKGKKMDGSKFLSMMRDLYDELDAYIRDMEDHLGGG
jgi:hypothetical protein